ncbi:MAG: S24/S26 family peptidase [Ruminococcus sp.]|nr:S24/S26 family peptidase [Ruminococcus sp.]
MADTMNYEDYIDRYGTLTYSNVGTSMLPLIRQGKDLFVITKKGRHRFKRGDVVLYRRPPKRYVLHRIVEVRPKDYVILGDNCISKEYGILDSDILGVMTAFFRSGKEHSINERGYRLYTWVIIHTIPVRVFFKKALMKLKRAAKKLLRRV